MQGGFGRLIGIYNKIKEELKTNSLGKEVDGIILYSLKKLLYYEKEILTKNKKLEKANLLIKELEEKIASMNQLLIEEKDKKEFVNTILLTLHEKYPNEKVHSERVSNYAVMVGKRLGYSRSDMETLRTASILHDIGKIAIDYSVINKPGSLTNQEYEEVKKHTSSGHKILSSIGSFSDIADIIVSHHERIDGKGYPKGLEGNQINQPAKIIAVCDAYDAMTSERTYKLAMPKNKAIEELILGKNTQFDKDIVDVFVSCIA